MERRNRLKVPVRLLGASLLFSVVLPAVASAAGGAHHGEPTFWDTKYYWVNFLLYVGLLYVLLKKPVSAGWNGRTATIAEAVNRGKLQLEKAEADLREARSRLASVDAEIAKIKSDIRRDTDLEGKQIIEDSRARAVRIVHQGKASAEAEKKALDLQLRRELAEAVLERAEAQIRRDVTAESDRGLRKAALSGMHGLVQ